MARAGMNWACRKRFKPCVCGFFLQFVKTILSQGHLTPLPLYVSPVFWAYDYALRVYPVPDLLVIADKHDPFTVTSTDCLCINPVRSPGHSHPSWPSLPAPNFTHTSVVFPLFLHRVRFPGVDFPSRCSTPPTRQLKTGK